MSSSVLVNFTGAVQQTLGKLAPKVLGTCQAQIPLSAHWELKSLSVSQDQA